MTKKLNFQITFTVILQKTDFLVGNRNISQSPRHIFWKYSPLHFLPVINSGESKWLDG